MKIKLIESVEQEVETPVERKMYKKGNDPRYPDFPKDWEFLKVPSIRKQKDYGLEGKEKYSEYSHELLDRIEAAQQDMIIKDDFVNMDELFDQLDMKRIEYRATNSRKDRELGDFWINYNPQTKFKSFKIVKDSKGEPILNSKGEPLKVPVTGKDKLERARKILAKYPGITTTEKKFGNEVHIFIRPEENARFKPGKDYIVESKESNASLISTIEEVKEDLESVIERIKSLSQKLSSTHRKISANLNMYMIPHLESWTGDYDYLKNMGYTLSEIIEKLEGEE